jgi:hypothetical protein
MAVKACSVVIVFSQEECEFPALGRYDRSAVRRFPFRGFDRRSFAAVHRFVDRVEAACEDTASLYVFIGLQRAFAATPTHVLDQFLFAPSQVGF